MTSIDEVIILMTITICAIIFTVSLYAPSFMNYVTDWPLCDVNMTFIYIFVYFHTYRFHVMNMNTKARDFLKRDQHWKFYNITRARALIKEEEEKKDNFPERMSAQLIQPAPSYRELLAEKIHLHPGKHKLTRRPRELPSASPPQQLTPKWEDGWDSLEELHSCLYPSFEKTASSAVSSRNSRCRECDR